MKPFWANQILPFGSAIGLLLVAAVACQPIPPPSSSNTNTDGAATAIAAATGTAIMDILQSTPTPSKKPTAVPPTSTSAPPLSPSQTPQFTITEVDYLSDTLNEMALNASLVCLATGPIIILDVSETVQFLGNGRASSICWIGPQTAGATNLTGSSLKHVTVIAGNPEEIAIQLVHQWAKEMMTRPDGCGPVPCSAADMAVIRADGTVIRPN